MQASRSRVVKVVELHTAVLLRSTPGLAARSISVPESLAIDIVPANQRSIPGNEKAARQGHFQMPLLYALPTIGMSPCHRLDQSRYRITRDLKPSGCGSNSLPFRDVSLTSKKAVL